MGANDLRSALLKKWVCFVVMRLSDCLFISFYQQQGAKPIRNDGKWGRSLRLRDSNFMRRM